MDPSPSPMRKRNHLLWVGPLVVFAGAVSYFEVFARFASLRDFPWVNLPVVLIGVALSAVGLWRALAQAEVYRGKILGSLGLALSLLLGGLFCAYVFVISNWLPEPSISSQTLTVAPDFTLSDSAGRPVRLSDYRGRKVYIVFYRGYW